MINNQTVLIDPTLARKLSLMELSAINSSQENSDKAYTLANRPITLYGQDRQPLYYEFIVYDGDHQQIGFVRKPCP